MAVVQSKILWIFYIQTKVFISYEFSQETLVRHFQHLLCNAFTLIVRRLESKFNTYIIITSQDVKLDVLDLIYGNWRDGRFSNFLTAGLQITFHISIC